jgi:predicted DNA-binding transcriptional regulator AlpA
MDTRSTTDNNPAAVNMPANTHDVRLPRWVNEPLPDVRAILSGREISRLTRRPRWLLLGLAALGQFPKRRTHCGKPIGWHRADVLDWLTQHMTIEPERPTKARRCRHERPSQTCLPLEIRPTRRLNSAAHRRHCAGGDRP